MGKKELTDAMRADRVRIQNDRGWSGLTNYLGMLSDRGFQLLLDWGPDRFMLMVWEQDFNIANGIAQGYKRLSEDNVDEFLRLQREHAPAKPLVDGTVAAMYSAWFNCGVGVTTTQ